MPMIVLVAFHTREEANVWMINKGCSHHMTSNKMNFSSLKKWNGGLVKLGDEGSTQICGKGIITIGRKRKISTLR